ncbi:MAG: radical SAM protein, partial [archaeon]
TKSKLTDYVINPYVGCQHGCKYCYAVFIKRFQNIQEPWGEFLHARVNSGEVLKKELELAANGHIWMSSVTDCYTPAESSYKITRGILQTLADSPRKNNFSLEILTKSVLVRRDFDLIKSIGAELGVSINSLDDGVRKEIEPFASPPLERIKALKEAKEKGIRVFGFISPVLPGITNLEELFCELSFCDYVWVELLNTKNDVLMRLLPVIKEIFPSKFKDFEFAINSPIEYRKNIESEVLLLSKKYCLKVKRVVVH